MHFCYASNAWLAGNKAMNGVLYPLGQLYIEGAKVQEERKRAMAKINGNEIRPGNVLEHSGWRLCGVV